MWNSQEKNIKSANHVSNITLLDWSKTTKQSSVNSTGKFLCQYQVSRQASNWFLIFPSQIVKILSSLLRGYFSGISCTFHFGYMFNGFLTELNKYNIYVHWFLCMLNVFMYMFVHAKLCVHKKSHGC